MSKRTRQSKRPQGDDVRLVAEVKRLRPRRELIPLGRYWRLGGLVKRIGSKYGEARVRTLAKKTGLGRATMYLCRRFRRLWPKKSDLDRVTRRGLTFSHVKALSHRKLTDQEREELEQSVQKDRLGVRELQGKVKELTAGRPGRRKRPPLFDGPVDIW